ncbi:MAG: peptidylprolyl isomerase [Dysgonamonadaceae bacterium]|jgi:peptidyl-prolyl cis-trans isomerase SurA|nr:peptidylprolyl isomerase [Dysgonamonadaceae bacterium]
MKKILVLVILVFNFYFVSSQEKNNPVVMTIAEKEIPLSEFLFLAQKDGSVNLLDKKSLENYVELFKKFKLKVAEAEALRIHQSRAFEEELSKYQLQLRASYLSDKEGEAAAMREIYDRGKDILSVSHILFPLPPMTVSKDTVAVYNEAYKAYQQILNGEDFSKVGQSLAADEKTGVSYREIDYVYPLQLVKAFEDVAFSLPVGVVSKPVRTTWGFHLIRVNKKITNPGKIRVAHILIGSVDGIDVSEEEDRKLLQKAEEICEKIKNGEEFEALVSIYSSDANSAAKGGVLPYFGLGEMVKPFEQAAFALAAPGDVSKPVRTRFGYHIIKLIDRKERDPYEEAERAIYGTMKSGEWNFDLYKGYDEREKKRMGYVFYPDAYDDLQRLCDDYFPTDTAFYNRASAMNKTLMHLNGIDFPQSEFAEYVHRNPFSTKSYAGDFLSEVYRLFIRDIVTELGKRNLEKDFPEYSQLVKEYHDGILLFEVSNERIWSKPLEDQARLEEEWVKELNEKYKTSVNWKVLKKIKKYIHQPQK